MYKLDSDIIRKILLDEMHYSPESVNLFLKNFPLLHDILGLAVDQWLSDRKIPELEIDGLSIQTVMKKRRSHFLAAIKEMNRLLDPALSPEERKKLGEMLARPVRFQ